MRSRSRQPVKRYKKLLAEIFPKSPVSILYNTIFTLICKAIMSTDKLRMAYLTIYICATQMVVGHLTTLSCDGAMGILPGTP